MNKLKEIIERVKEYEDNNCFELKTSVVLHWLNEIQKEAINYTHCCKSDSEQLSCKCGLPKRKQGIGFSCMRTDCDANTTT